MTNGFHYLLLADDDPDDCTFFKDALSATRLPASLQIVNDGVELMHHLRSTQSELPEILFLDLNMPKKSGFECLEEIKDEESLKHLPVVVFSTSADRNNSDSLYEKGAHYYIRKPADFNSLQSVIERVITLITSSPVRPQKENFVLV